MPDEPVLDADERALDDAALEALAESIATSPPSSLRARLLREAALHRRLQRVERRRRIWAGGAAAAAAAGVVLAVLFADARRVAQQAQQETDRATATLVSLEAAHAQVGARLAELEARLASVQDLLRAQTDVMRVMAEPRLRTAQLAPQTATPGRGRVLLDPAAGEVAVVVTELPPPAGGRTYELWAIRGDRPPEPAGLFAPSSPQSFAARLGDLPKPEEITAFAVSLEPAGGTQSPTGPIVLVGPVRTGS